MGYCGKYGAVTTERGDIPVSEPVFVLRARDRHSRAILAHYVQLCEGGGSPVRHVRLAADALARFAMWQEENPELVRTPASEGSRAWLARTAREQRAALAAEQKRQRPLLARLRSPGRS